jgi:hypothetical protein
LDAFLLSIALERVTIKRFMLARAAAAKLGLPVNVVAGFGQTG